MPRGKQITFAERLLIEKSLNEKLNPTEISRLLKRSVSGIHQEISRGGGKWSYSAEEGEKQRDKVFIERVKNLDAYRATRLKSHDSPLNIQERKIIEKYKETTSTCAEIAKLIGRDEETVFQEYEKFGDRIEYNAKDAQDGVDNSKLRIESLEMQVEILHQTIKRLLNA